MARRVALALGALALIATAAPLSAQKAQERQGFNISFGIGGGSAGLSCDGCDGLDRESSTAMYLNIGGTVRPNLVVGGEISGWTKSEDGADGTISSLLATAHYYPIAQQGLYVGAGLGMTRLSFDDGTGEMTNTGLGFQLGAGYDIRVARNFSLTPYAQWVKGMKAEVEVDGTSTGTKVGADVWQFGLGFTWH